MTISSLEKNLYPFIWMNGKLIKSSTAKIHALTHSLHYSGAVFEGERAYGGKVFKLKEHTERLLESARSLMLEVPYSFDDIIKAHELFLSKNKVEDAYVRPLIWRGSESLNITNSSLSVNMLIAAVISSGRPSDGLKLHVSKWRKPSPESMPPQCKSSGHYNMSIVNQQEARLNGYDDAILLDNEGHIAECTTTNIFFVEKDKLVTPIADKFLNGITRQTIIEIAQKLWIKVEEKRITLGDLEKYTECFITGTAAEIRSVKSIDLQNKTLYFTENNLASKLHVEYAKLVRMKDPKIVREPSKKHGASKALKTRKEK